MAYPFLSPGARLLAVKLKDSDGNPLGEVKEWMMDVDEGKVVFVLATFGDMAGEYVAIPWEQMKADKENGGYQVKADRDQLMNGPRISTEEVKDLITDHSFLDGLFQHYGTKPYWQGSEAPETSQPSASTDTTPASVQASQDERNSEEGQSQPNDLKEIRDEYAAKEGDELEGRTNEEHGEGSGYGG
jgi:hypothetical protein